MPHPLAGIAEGTLWAIGAYAVCIVALFVWYWVKGELP